MKHDRSLSETENQDHGSGSKNQCKMCVLHEHLLMAGVVGFHRNVISCELRQRGVRLAQPKLAAAAEISECGRGKAVGLASILDQQQFLPRVAVLAR